MEHIQWIFSGIGVAILSIATGFFIQKNRKAIKETQGDISPIIEGDGNTFIATTNERK